jgi:hypothetical protein
MSKPKAVWSSFRIALSGKEDHSRKSRSFQPKGSSARLSREDSRNVGIDPATNKLRRDGGQCGPPSGRYGKSDGIGPTW